MELTTQVDGVTVIGCILKYSSSDILVEITHPYRDLTDERRVPATAGGRQSPSENSKEEVALRLLEEIYQVRHFLEVESEHLIAAFAKLKANPDFPTHDGRGQFLAKRRALGEQLSAFAITENEHQEKLSQAQFLRDYLQLKTTTMIEALFDEHFPMDIGDDLRAQLMVVLEEKSEANG